ncbi:hypothetical protein K8R66_03190 [bacterium]|nr:hypothetical protein [bacterium]
MSSDKQDNGFVIENKFSSGKSERSIDELAGIESLAGNHSVSESNGLNAKELRDNILRLSGKEDISKLDKKELLFWYVKISRWPVLFLVLFNIIIITTNNYLLSLLKMPIEILVFIILSYFVINKKHKSPKITGISVAFVGFEAGILIAIFKFFWHRELWNVFNFSVEAIFLTLIALVTGVIAGKIFYNEDRA